MAYDARIILAQQPLNALAAIQGGTEAAAGQNAFMRQAAYQKMLQANGPGIMSGDRNALNAFAMFDPAAAMGMQESRLNMEAKRQSMDILSAEEKRRVAEHAAGLSAAEREVQARQIEEAVKMGLMAQSPQEYDAMMQRLGQPNLVGTFDQRQALAARAMSMAEVFKQAFPEPVKPADEYGRYVAEETAAGRQPLDRIGFEQAKKGQRTVYGPDGQPIYSEGPATNMKLTEQQSKDLVYWKRASGASPEIDKHEGALTSLGDNVAGNVPLVGNYMVSEGYQLGRQAAAEWLAAILRKDTGAAITNQEFDLYGPMFLPMPGDSPATLEQKRTARKRAEDAIKSGLGTAEVLAEAQKDSPQAEVATGGVPEGVDPAVWEYMTPEEKALWK